MVPLKPKQYLSYKKPNKFPLAVVVLILLLTGTGFYWYNDGFCKDTFKDRSTIYISFVGSDVMHYSKEEGKWEKAKLDGRLYPGDRVQTGFEDITILHISGKNNIRLSPSTELVWEGKKQGLPQIRLQQGSFYLEALSDSYVLSSSFGRFVLNEGVFYGENLTGKIIRVFCISGSIDVHSPQDDKLLTSITAGNIVSINDRHTLNQRHFSMQEMNEWVKYNASFNSDNLARGEIPPLSMNDRASDSSIEFQNRNEGADYYGRTSKDSRGKFIKNDQDYNNEQLKHAPAPIAAKEPEYPKAEVKIHPQSSYDPAPHQRQLPQVDDENNSYPRFLGAEEGGPHNPRQTQPQHNLQNPSPPSRPFDYEEQLRREESKRKHMRGFYYLHNDYRTQGRSLSVPGFDLNSPQAGPAEVYEQEYMRGRRPAYSPGGS